MHSKSVRRSLLIVGLVQFLVLVTGHSSRAGLDPVTKCEVAKVKAAGKLSKSLLTCHSKAAADSAQPDPECINKAITKAGEAFAKATGCDGDIAGTRTQTAQAVDAIVDEVLPLGHGASAGKCESLKLKASGGYVLAVFKAHAKYIGSGDSAKLSESVQKAVGKLDEKFIDADAEGGCENTANSSVVQTIADNCVDAVTDCVTGAQQCEGAGQDGGPGGVTVTTDSEADGATAADVIETTVTSQGPGSVIISEGPITQSAPPGFELFGEQVDITAPDASAVDPLIIVFTIDVSIAPVPYTGVQIFKAGVLVPDCSGAAGTASPDPCVESRTLLGDGDVEITVLSSTASPWTAGVSTVTAEDCPISMTWETEADDGVAATASRHEVGTNGRFHHVFPLDKARLAMGLSCPNATSPCGDCTVTGVLTTLSNCRCASDNLTTCDVPFGTDADNCGIIDPTCNCYASAPEPLHGGGTSACSLLRLVEQPTGTWDPDAGDGDIVLNEQWRIYTGISLAQPCPTCNGDTTPNDGLRDGTCSGGANNSAACDATGTDASFPAPGGGGYSLDCMPAASAYLNGATLSRPVTHSTGTSSLNAALSCSSGEFCHCGTCTGDSAIGCSSNVDCAAAAAGTCVAGGSPDSCTSACLSVGGGYGECDGDFDMYCDGNLRVDGSGIAGCASNSDCDGFGVGWGACELSQARPCFVDPLTTDGTPSATDPVTAASSCIASVSNPAVNVTLGLPGPIRVVTQRHVTYGQ